MKIPLWIKFIFFSVVIFTSVVLPLTFLESLFDSYGDIALDWAGSDKLLVSLIVILALAADVLLPVPNGLTNTFAGMTILINLNLHDFWNTYEGVNSTHEMQNFFKNLGIFAGLLLLASIHIDEINDI